MKYLKFAIASCLTLVLFAPVIGLCQQRARQVSYTDIWWSPQEPGWGLTVFQTGNIIAAAWYTYTDTNKSYWVILVGATQQVDGSYLGDIYQSAGPGFNLPYVAASFQQTKVGTGRLSFSATNVGQLIFTIGDQTTTKTINRLSVGMPTINITGKSQSGLSASGCTNTANNKSRTRVFSYERDGLYGDSGTISANASGAITISTYDASPSCLIQPCTSTCAGTGAWVQEGAYINASGNYTCEGRQGSWALSRGKPTDDGGFIAVFTMQDTVLETCRSNGWLRLIRGDSTVD